MNELTVSELSYEESHIKFRKEVLNFCGTV